MLKAGQQSGIAATIARVPAGLIGRVDWTSATLSALTSDEFDKWGGFEIATIIPGEGDLEKYPVKKPKIAGIDEYKPLLGVYGGGSLALVCFSKGQEVMFFDVS